MLNLESIVKSYGEKRVLSGVSMRIPDGVTASLSGMSGSGKTTLLRIAAGLEAPDSGTVSVSGRTAVVFAEPRLFPSVCVLENVTCVMRGGKRENEQKGRELLAALGLADAALLRPRELSSGMAARVALARALAYEAEVYLLDEPLASLDGELKSLVMEYLKAFLANRTALLITHDASEGDFLAARRFRLAEGSLSDITETEDGKTLCL